MLTLSGCDVILGVQWLKILGPILWNFSQFFMTFMLKGSNYTLKGLTPTALSLVGGKEFGHVTN